jgi:elongation factor Ts
MVNYGPKEIKEIREATGAGMLDVKKALDESNGDKKTAIKIIRLKGLKGIAKRESRDTSAGLVISKIIDNKVGYMLELNSETDFVSKSPKFLELADYLLKETVKNDFKCEECALNNKDVKEKIITASATFGEKLVLKHIAKLEAEYVTSYMHKSNKDLPAQVGVLIGINGVSIEKAETIGHEVAMHIAAYSPKFLSNEDVPKEVVNEEIEVAMATAQKEGKPANIAENIARGKLNAYYKENVLLNQPFAKDPKKTVKDILDGATIVHFIRFRVGS